MNSRDLSTESIAPSDSILNSNTIPVTSNVVQEHPKPTSNRTSICWNFFYYPTDPTAITLSCYYCKAKIAFNIKIYMLNLRVNRQKERKKLFRKI
jgi:hypothetical protein